MFGGLLRTETDRTLALRSKIRVLHSYHSTEDLPADAASRRRPKKKKIREVEVRKREVDHMQTLGHKKSTDFCTF